MEREIEQALGSAVAAVAGVSGGDVAQAFRVTLEDERTVFAKTKAGADPEFFVTEACGLETLRGARQLPVPEVLHVSHDQPLLVLSWIAESRRRPSSDHRFGAALARLHRSGAESFGRADQRPTGSRGVPNQPTKTWSDFYATNRLLPLARLAYDEGALETTTIAMIESIAGRLDKFGGADEPPSLLHGDLWAGNRIVDQHGESWLIDPAQHGGHREFDLAMTQLFGGWQPDMIDGYQAEWPLADGWQGRIALHQLAPLAVHAIKFGGGYVNATAEAARQYT